MFRKRFRTNLNVRTTMLSCSCRSALKARRQLVLRGRCPSTTIARASSTSKPDPSQSHANETSPSPVRRPKRPLPSPFLIHIALTVSFFHEYHGLTQWYSIDAVHLALRQNKSWAQSTASEKPDLFPTLASGQHPQILWIGCSDSPYVYSFPPPPEALAPTIHLPK